MNALDVLLQTQQIEPSRPAVGLQRMQLLASLPEMGVAMRLEC